MESTNSDYKYVKDSESTTNMHHGDFPTLMNLIDSIRYPLAN